MRLGALEERHIKEVQAIEQIAQPAPWSERSFRNELNHPGGIFLVCETSKGVVGYGGAWVVADECHIITVTVTPDSQRQGIGSKLVSELLHRSLEKGATCATLEVRAGNSGAIQLYEKFGFSQVGVRKKYYPDNQEDAIVMWLYDLAAWAAN